MAYGIVWRAISLGGDEARCVVAVNPGSKGRKMIGQRNLRLGAFLAALIAVLGVRAAGDGESALEQRLQVADVAVTIEEAAFVDWNRPSSAVFQIQNDIIRQVFRSAALDGAESSLFGDRPAVLSINITHFDILSDIEQLFCCARNEVMADYLLIDAESGEVIAEAETLNFDHVSRGGFLTLLNRNTGEDQLSRLYDIISSGTSSWLSSEF